jgi:hypothetical protein
MKLIRQSPSTLLSILKMASTMYAETLEQLQRTTLLTTKLEVTRYILGARIRGKNIYFLFTLPRRSLEKHLTV